MYEILCKLSAFQYLYDLRAHEFFFIR